MGNAAVDRGSGIVVVIGSQGGSASLRESIVGVATREDALASILSGKT